MRDFESLDVWRAAHRLVLVVYRLTAALPPEERFGVGDQMEYYAHLCLDLGYVSRDQFLALRSDSRAVRRQIWGLIRDLGRNRAEEGQG